MTGFTLSFALEAAFLVVAFGAALLVPASGRQTLGAATDAPRGEVGEAASGTVEVKVS